MHVELGDHISLTAKHVPIQSGDPQYSLITKNIAVEVGDGKVIQLDGANGNFHLALSMPQHKG